MAWYIPVHFMNWAKFKQTKANSTIQTEVYSGICPGGLNFFIFLGGLGTQWGLKSIDFTGLGGELSPPPLNTPLNTNTDYMRQKGTVS